MANTERARKLLVRSAIATSATVTTLFGAQNLAALDLAKADLNNFVGSDPVVMADTLPTQDLQAQITNTPANLEPTLVPTAQILHSAPTITILRQPGQVNTTGTNVSNNQIVIQPPQPVAVAQPAPIIVQPPPQQVQAQPQVIQQQAQQPVVIVRSRSSSSSRSHSSR